MTVLRERMVEDMKIRGFTPGTQAKYLEAITALAQHYRRPPDQLTPEQMRAYLLYLIETRQFAKSTFRLHLSALKFLYRWTLGWSGRSWPCRGSRATRSCPWCSVARKCGACWTKCASPRPAGA